MSTVYPGAIDAITQPVAGNGLNSPLSHTQNHKDLIDSVTAVENTLGTNPEGGSATVKARLSALDVVVEAKAGAGAGRGPLPNVATYGMPGEWVPANANPLIVAVGGDARMVVFGFTAHENITLTAILINVSTQAASGGVAEFALYGAVFEDQLGYRAGAKIGSSLGSVAIDTTGSKSVTGLSRVLTKGTAYVIGVSFSKTCSCYRTGYHSPAMATWRTDNLNLGVTQAHIASASPPPDPASGAVVNTTQTASPAYSPFGLKWTTP